MSEVAHTHRWSNWFPVADKPDTVRWYRQCLHPGCDAMERKK